MIHLDENETGKTKEEATEGQALVKGLLDFIHLSRRTKKDASIDQMSARSTPGAGMRLNLKPIVYGRQTRKQQSRSSPLLS